VPGSFFPRTTKITDQLTTAIIGDVSEALSEDVASGDITAAIIPASSTAEAIVIAREPMTLAGQPWVNEVFAQLDNTVVVEWMYNDGEHVPADTELCIIRGPARAILSGERTALNFVQLLSATATLTSRYVNAIEGTQAKILDTRKTIPGLRQAQKYAVRCGGGNNHRVGLYDAILIKENHIISAGGIAAAVDASRAAHAELPVEIEVESVSEMRKALEAGADRLLLDNFDISDLQRAVEINQEEGQPPADLEASGGITLDTIHAIAETGVDYISVGALTKDVKAIDLSMRFRYDD
jgi:nicotinate-nucleotide pyrophosphorylase (carboxylating)